MYANTSCFLFVLHTRCYVSFSHVMVYFHVCCYVLSSHVDRHVDG